MTFRGIGAAPVGCDIAFNGPASVCDSFVNNRGALGGLAKSESEEEWFKHLLGISDHSLMVLGRGIIPNSYTSSYWVLPAK